VPTNPFLKAVSPAVIGACAISFPFKGKGSGNVPGGGFDFAFSSFPCSISSLACSLASCLVASSISKVVFAEEPCSLSES